MTEKSKEPTLITAMPAHGRHSRPDFTATEAGLEEHERGWNACEAGEPFDDTASQAWQQGWKDKDRFSA